MDSNVLTLVTIFLPLSSLWASASLDQRKKPSPGKKFQGKLLGRNGTATTGPFVDEKSLLGPLSPANTAASVSSQSDPPSPSNTHDQHGFVDLEAQKVIELGFQRAGI